MDEDILAIYSRGVFANYCYLNCETATQIDSDVLID